MDTCPKCECLLRIGKNYLTFENDDTPDKETEAYENLDMICGNQSCELFEKVVKTKQHKRD